MLTALFENIPLGAFLVDQEGNIKTANPTFYKIMGGTPGSDINLIHDQGMKAVGGDKVIQVVFSDGKKATVELETISPWKKEISVRMILIPVKEGVLGILEDMQEVRIMDREIRDSHERLQVSYKKLQELDRLKSDVLANVSHELNTPATILRSTLDMMATSEDQDEKEELMQMARKALVRMEDMVSILVYGARFGEIELTRGQVDIRSLFTRIIERVMPFAIEKKVTIKVIMPEFVPPIMADPNAMHHALYNLVTNAVKFNRPGGDVLLDARPTGDSVEIIVSDSGMGIKSEDLEHIFEPLHQIDSSATRKHGGVGMGLTNVKNIIEAHGGRIWAISEEGEGCSFHIEVPLGDGCDGTRH